MSIIIQIALKGSVPFRRAWPEVSDLVPVIIVKVIKGMNSILQKKNSNFNIKEIQLFYLCRYLF